MLNIQQRPSFTSCMASDVLCMPPEHLRAAPSLTLTPYISSLFEFRSHLLLAADVGGHHRLCAHAQRRHQTGGAVHVDARQHQRRSSGFRPVTGRPAARCCGSRGQRLDHQRWQKVCAAENVKTPRLCLDYRRWEWIAEKVTNIYIFMNVWDMCTFQLNSWKSLDFWTTVL